MRISLVSIQLSLFTSLIATPDNITLSIDNNTSRTFVFVDEITRYSATLQPHGHASACIQPQSNTVTIRIADSDHATVLNGTSILLRCMTDRSLGDGPRIEFHQSLPDFLAQHYQGAIPITIQDLRPRAPLASHSPTVVAYTTSHKQGPLYVTQATGAKRIQLRELVVTIGTQKSHILIVPAIVQAYVSRSGLPTLGHWATQEDGTPKFDRMHS